MKKPQKKELENDEPIQGTFPSEKIIDQILEKVLVQRHGENWKDMFIESEQESEFDKNRKKFYSHSPDLGIKFQAYKSELKQCIQRGIHPAFGYAPLSFGEHKLSQPPNFEQLPASLSVRFRKGIKPKQSDLKKKEQALKEMDDQIQRKQQYGEDLDTFYMQERLLQPTKMIESPLKNLPSPLFHAINSNGKHLKKYVVEKRLEEEYLFQVDQHFTSTSFKPFKLVKRDLMNQNEHIHSKESCSKSSKKCKSKKLKSTMSSNQNSPRKRLVVKKKSTFLTSGQESSVENTGDGSATQGNKIPQFTLVPKQIPQGPHTFQPIQPIEEIPKRPLVNLKIQTGKSFDFHLQENEANKAQGHVRVHSAAINSIRFATTGTRQPMSSGIVKKNPNLRKDRPSSILHQISTQKSTFIDQNSSPGIKKAQFLKGQCVAMPSICFSNTPESRMRAPIDMVFADSKKENIPFSQKRDSATTLSYFSTGVISRADLKFRLRTQKQKQNQAFRNTMKDLTQFADLETKVEGAKCPTSTSQNQGDKRYSHDIFSDQRMMSPKKIGSRTMMSDSTNVTPGIHTIQERPFDESAMSSPNKGKKPHSMKRIQSYRIQQFREKCKTIQINNDQLI